MKPVSIFNARRLNVLATAALIAAAIFGTVASANAASPPACLPDGANLSNADPFVPTASQRTVMQESFNSPEVAALTAKISRYLAGTADRVSQKAFRSADADVSLHYPYSILSDERGMFGGFTIIVWFAKTSDAFLAWNYRLGSSSLWEVRDFTRLACDSKQRAWIRNRYGALFRDIHS